jgi:hypothetical protein
LLLRWSGPIAVTCVSDALRQVTILAAFAVEEDEGIFRPLDVILVTLLWSMFADIGDSGTPATVTSLFYLGDARLLVLMSCLYLYYRLAYSHLPDLPRT